MALFPVSSGGSNRFQGAGLREPWHAEVILYGLLALYLLACVVSGCLHMGLSFMGMIRIHPMREKDTPLNSFLFNCMLVREQATFSGVWSLDAESGKDCSANVVEGKCTGGRQKSVIMPLSKVSFEYHAF